MYYFSAYLSLFLAVILVPFLVPIRTKSVIFHRIKVILSTCLVVSVLVSLTPEKAVTGAPFHGFGQSNIALYSCSYQIESRASFCEDSSSRYQCFCTNENARATISHCYYNSFKSQINDFTRMCHDSFNISLTQEDMARSHQYYLEHAQEPQGPSVIMDTPIVLEEPVIQLYKAAYEQFLGNYDLSVVYGELLIGFWMVVFVLAAAGNWGKIVFPRFFTRSTDPLTNWFRRNISLPATRGTKKTTEKPFLKVLDMLVPTRAESLILATFLIITTFLVFHNIHYYEGDPLFHHKRKALLRYHAVRTSILASEMMPLLILFGGRNNFLQWVTRWDYSTFITFHRWISRVIVTLILIHTVCYSLYLKSVLRDLEAYVIAGGLAIIAGVFILIQGLLVLRRRWYEMFLLIHIVLAAVFVFGAWYHVNDLYCLWFYYYSAMIWVFDRVVRVGRLCSFGFPKAKVLLLADETLKVIVPKPRHWDAIPGGHAFIHFLRPSCFWQSHPFTYTISPDNSEEIVMFIKVKDGVTSRLYHYLRTHPGRSTSIRVAVEGSYGEKTPASRYDSAVFVAGGNGIPGIYAEALDLERSNNTKQSIRLLWVIREYKSLYWFYEELLSLKNSSIDTTVYVTKPDSESCLEDFELRIPQEEATHDTKLLAHPKPNYHSTSTAINAKTIILRVKNELSHVDFKHGRPSMKGLVHESLVESNGSTCFITCGHPVMVDDLRHAVVDNISNKEKKRVDYFEQLQVWA